MQSANSTYSNLQEYQRQLTETQLKRLFLKSELVASEKGNAFSQVNVLQFVMDFTGKCMKESKYQRKTKKCVKY